MERASRLSKGLKFIRFVLEKYTFTTKRGGLNHNTELLNRKVNYCKIRKSIGENAHDIYLIAAQSAECAHCTRKI